AGMPSNFLRATCVQRLDGSRDYAISPKYRIFATFFIDKGRDIRAESRLDIFDKHASRLADTVSPLRRTADNLLLFPSVGWQ
uniref:Uncharacterized protein n=1 Tax=Cannabis sativa TaxID=3483 RepID=A0A803QSP5_CANSA